MYQSSECCCKGIFKIQLTFKSADFGYKIALYNVGGLIQSPEGHKRKRDWGSLRKREFCLMTVFRLDLWHQLLHMYSHSVGYFSLEYPKRATKFVEVCSSSYRKLIHQPTQLLFQHTKLIHIKDSEMEKFDLEWFFWRFF